MWTPILASKKSGKNVPRHFIFTVRRDYGNLRLTVRQVKLLTGVSVKSDLGDTIHTSPNIR